MRYSIKTIVTAAIAVGSITSANAQNTRSGYFIDDYTYRFEMNPAFGNSKNFIAMPGLGNVNASMNGTIGINDVLYNVDGRTTTFLNPEISASKVMGNIGDRNRVGADLKITLLAAGFKSWGGYNTIAINARSGLGVKLPGEIFSLLKEGASNKEYDISDVRAFANAYAEIAFGHSRDINSEWRVGANVKFLLGGANLDARLKNAHLILGENDWSITSEAEINANIKGLEYKTDINDDTHHEYVSGADVHNTGLNGFGMAFDFGAVYNPKTLPDWSFSASLLDFGFISWSNNMVASTNGVKTFNTDRYTFNVDDDAPNSFKHEWDKIKDDMSALYELDDMGNKGGQTRMLGATMHLGAQYTLPVYRPLTFGLLNTTRIQGAFSWTDFRLSANVAPAKCIDGGINMSLGTFGVGFGWIVNFHTTGFNMFLAMDRTLGKLAKQGVPLSSNGSVNLGINFPF